MAADVVRPAARGSRMSAFHSPKRTGPAGPLSGIKVLDLSAYIAGPYGCTLLADQGADVIKVEPPAGDNLRQYPSTLVGENRAFLGVNRSKRGVVFDLKNDGDRRSCSGWWPRPTCWCTISGRASRSGWGSTIPRSRRSTRA